MLNIIRYPNKILRKKAKPIAFPFDKEFAKDMAEAMRKHNGIGLAAPQAGRSQRIIVVRKSAGAVALLNPEIIDRSKETIISEEGCLSLPGITIKVPRHKNIVVAALDIEGKEIVIKVKDNDLLSIVLQHEIDHLDGRLIIDFLPFLQRVYYFAQSCFRKK